MGRINVGIGWNRHPSVRLKVVSDNQQDEEGEGRGEGARELGIWNAPARKHEAPKGPKSCNERILYVLGSM